MGWVAGVEIRESDWNRFAGSGPRAGIICHLGASQDRKTWPESSWVAFLQKLLDSGKEKITIIGSPDEKALSEKICGQLIQGERVENLTGETQFGELKNFIATAKLYVGADSGPMHVASFCSTPILNLSVGPVRFWETGPVSKGSRILVSDDPQMLGSDVVFDLALEMLNGVESKRGYIECKGRGGIHYVVHPDARIRIDQWSLVDWLYFDGPLPRFEGEIQKAVCQIIEVCQLCLGQLEVFYKSPDKVEVVGILDRLDEIIEMLRQHILPLRPLLDAFKVQKENIPPAPREEIFYQTKKCYTDLHHRAEQLSGLSFEILKGQSS